MTRNVDKLLIFSLSLSTQDIPVSVIASFNKMKSLTTDISLVTQAMERSPLLQVREYAYNTHYNFMLHKKYNCMLENKFT